MSRSVSDAIHLRRVPCFPASCVYDLLDVRILNHVDESTGTRNVFAWNKDRYPDPAHLGQTLEGVAPPNNRSLRDTGADSCMGGVTVITNVKPWILDVHPWRNRISDKVFVQAASDFSPPVAPQGGAHSDHRPETSMVWSSGLGDNAPGSYIDFSSFAGAGWWKTHLRNELLDNGLTGVWWVALCFRQFYEMTCMGPYHSVR